VRRFHAWDWVKWLALIVAVVFMTRYVALNAARLQAYPFTLDLPLLILAALALLAGKILIAAAASLSLTILGQKSDFLHLMRLYSVTQLGKYVPGGVWQFVGRGVGYRMEGMSARSIFVALGLENAALILGSFWFGYFLSLITRAQWIAGPPGFLWAPALILTLLYLLLEPPRRFFPQEAGGGNRPRASRSGRVLLLLLQGGIWALLGLSFYLVLLGVGIHSVPLIDAAGVFALSWLAGFLAVFVPGGIGVREGVLGFLLAPYVEAPVAFAGALIARLLWLIIEAAMVLLSYLLTAGKPAASAEQ
jgi:uncharacterized membrane protein YbhN (UPF0104 family)